jgi:hypothetical protein
MIPSFGAKTGREFRYSFQPFKRPTLSEVAQEPTKEEVVKLNRVMQHALREFKGRVARRR